MPFCNRFDPRKLLRSRKLEEKSYKNGLRHGIFNGVYDKYTGAWIHDKKTGKGAMLTKHKDLYEGDFLNDYRHGAGVLAYYLPKYKVFRLSYRGDWKYGRMHGEGIRSYPEGFYVGSFQYGKRHGLGQMYYNDGAYYDGEWVKDQRQGVGMLVLPNGNRYEGSWLNDQKHGKARLYFLNVGQIQIGVWRLDVCVWSTISNLPFRQAALAPTLYPLPVSKLRIKTGAWAALILFTTFIATYDFHFTADEARVNHRMAETTRSLKFSFRKRSENTLEDLQRVCDMGEQMALTNEGSADILVQYHYAGSTADSEKDGSCISTRFQTMSEMKNT